MLIHQTSQNKPFISFCLSVCSIGMSVWVNRKRKCNLVYSIKSPQNVIQVWPQNTFIIWKLNKFKLYWHQCLYVNTTKSAVLLSTGLLRRKNTLETWLEQNVDKSTHTSKFRNLKVRIFCTALTQAAWSLRMKPWETHKNSVITRVLYPTILLMFSSIKMLHCLFMFLRTIIILFLYSHIHFRLIYKTRSLSDAWLVLTSNERLSFTDLG